LNLLRFGLVTEVDSAVPVKWVVPAWEEVLAADRGGVEGRVEEAESERK
jgi:hypothetical protein